MFSGRSQDLRSTPLRLGVFLKRPTPGEVKTRLGRAIGPRASCELYRCFVDDALEWLPRLRNVAVTLFYSPAEARSEIAELARAAHRVALEPQIDGSLGERMHRAFQQLLPSGPGRAALVGTDCPLLDRRMIRRAAAALTARDVVLGPARDGGYYLVGLRRPDARLFEAIRWSSSDVLRATIARASAAGLRVAQLEELGDVDELSDLENLYSELVDAWAETRGGKRVEFPLRTFRWLTRFRLQNALRQP